MKRRIFCTLIFIICLGISISCFAITESDVQMAVESSSKETVSGNIFVWFLCAIAFMKVSQKIDSFMNSLGISVGRTGGSMMAEAMIAGKAIGAAFKSGGKFAGFGKGSPSGGGAPVGQGIFSGGIGRKMSDGAAGNVTGKGAGGMMSSFGRRMYENSVGKGGAFAASVIGSVARGEINKMGTISGANAKAAMESYFGYNAQASVEQNESSSSSFDVQQGGATVISGEAGADSGVGYADGGLMMFSDVEMGGGRITGTETSLEHPDGIGFALYDAEKYAKPEGDFETITAKDNSKWYKQYAVPTVDRVPYLDTKGNVQYNEEIVHRVPKAPMRKDRI